jgi:type IV secretion system protein TrbL
MGGTGIIDQFLATFTQYIDSGFGLLGGEVGYLATTLAAIDVTLAGLFWAWGADEDILARLVRKTLFVGVFAFLISNWNNLARIIFESFAGLGLKASGTGLSSAQFLQPECFIDGRTCLIRHSGRTYVAVEITEVSRGNTI